MLYRPAPRLLRRTVDHKFNGGGLRSETDKIFVLLQKAHELVSVEILTDVRLKQAKKLIELHGADKSILDIALECGFSSSQYFSTVFRNKFGKSPSCFRSP